MSIGPGCTLFDRDARLPTSMLLLLLLLLRGRPCVNIFTAPLVAALAPPVRRHRALAYARADIDDAAVAFPMCFSAA